jgi:hypothetical protein
MLTLRRILLAILLTALVIGCKPKSQPVGAEGTPAENLDKKRKIMQEQPEGPELRPKP